MRKEQLIEILQSCLLTFDGVSETELGTYMNPQNVKTGIGLFKFLENKFKQSLNNEQEVTKNENDTMENSNR